MLNEDYQDMLRALSGENVKFILIGAYTLAAHGYPRATMDIDIWVMPSLLMPRLFFGHCAVSALRCTT